MEAAEQEAKALMKSGEYQKASDALSSLLESRVAKYGETAQECAGTYLLYGKCLLGLVQTEMDVLGGMLKKQLKKKMESELGLSKDSSSDEEDKPEASDNGDLLEIAWEVLELARVIYSSSNQKENLSEVFLVMGDVSMESDNMKQALADYTQCLTLRETFLPPTDRRLAETHYSIALAHEYQSNTREALEHFNKAHRILQDLLNALTEKETEETAGEAKDLKGIVEELTAKIDELSKTERLPKLDRGSQEKRTSIQSTHIQDLGASNGAVVVQTKRKAEVLAASSDIAENGKKIKQCEPAVALKPPQASPVPEVQREEKRLKEIDQGPSKEEVVQGSPKETVQSSPKQETVQSSPKQETALE